MKIQQWVFASVVVAISLAAIILLALRNNQNGMAFSQSFASDQQVTADQTANYSSSFLTLHINDSFHGFDEVNVPLGSVVVWQNDGAITHFVISDTGLFDSGPIATGDSFTYVFTDSGSYGYHFDLDSSSKSTIVVQ